MRPHPNHPHQCQASLFLLPHYRLTRSLPRRLLRLPHLHPLSPTTTELRSARCRLLAFRAGWYARSSPGSLAHLSQELGLERCCDGFVVVDARFVGNQVVLDGAVRVHWHVTFTFTENLVDHGLSS